MWYKQQGSILLLENKLKERKSNSRLAFWCRSTRWNFPVVWPKKVETEHAFCFMVPFYNAQKWNTLLCILDCCNGLDQEPPQRCFLCVNVRLMREVKPKQAWLRHKEGACGVHDTPLLLPPRPVCPADVTERVGWWSTLIPSWESAEGESRPETQFFNPGRLLPPCSAR